MKRLSIFVLLLGFSNSLQAAEWKLFKKPVINYVVKKQGVYFGYEKGMYDFIEFGGDYQRKRITGLKTKINAFHYGFNYSLRENTAGYNLGYYHKKGVFGLTYGADIFGNTDFKNFIPSVSPMLGYKFAGFHLQTGYKLSLNNKFDIPVNTFFIRLRFTINQHTEWKRIK